MENMLKTACIQLTSSADMLANIARIEMLVAQASIQGAQLVATPENTFLIENSAEKSGKNAHDKRIFYTQDEHPAIKASKDIALKYNIWLLIGSVAVADDRWGITDARKSYNRSFLLNPHGEIVAKYDKIHLFDVEVGDGQTYRESAKIIAGDKAVLATTPWGKLGMSVCYDLRFPQLYRTLAKAGAKIIAVPAAFTQVTGEAHWHVLLRARAIETGCFVIAPAQTGIHDDGRKTFGHSLIIDPWGKILADAGTDEGIIMVDLDLEDVDRIQKKLPGWQHDQDFELDAQ